MDEQELFERSVALGLRAAKVVVERGDGLAGIDRLIWQCEHPPRLASVIDARSDATTKIGAAEGESAVPQADAPTGDD